MAAIAQRMAQNFLFSSVSSNKYLKNKYFQYYVKSARD